MGEAGRSRAALQERVAGAVELIVCSAEQPPRAASGGGAREGDTAGGENSSRPGVECVLVRAVEAPAEGVRGESHSTNSLRRKVGGAVYCSSRRWGTGLCHSSWARGSVTADDQSIQGRSGKSDGAKKGATVCDNVRRCRRIRKGIADGNARDEEYLRKP